jgi:peroxiredoxin
MALCFQSPARFAWTAGLIVALAGLLSGPSAAEDLGPAKDLGPPVGTKAPDIGKRLDQTGMPRTLGDVMGPNGLVLMFFRSADWCPYCQAQLIDVNGGHAEIEKRGYRVAALSYDSPDILRAFTVKRHIAYTFLSDPKSEVIDLYRLRDPQYAPGSRAYGVPRPIIFILDKDGVIKAKLFEESFKERPPVTAVISKLDELGKGS